jgi:hypothetical protein
VGDSVRTRSGQCFPPGHPDIGQSDQRFVTIEPGIGGG